MGHGDQNLNLPGNLNFAPDPARVQELMAIMLPEPFHLGRPCTDREAWEKVKSSEAGQRLLAEAKEAAKDEPRSHITNEDCLHVIETHDREPFNPLPGLVRTRQVLLPIAECLEPTGEYLPKIEEDIRRLCALKTWTFPLHERGRELYERKLIFTDLASVAFASNLVSALHVLGDKLSPETQQLIRDEIDERIFQPFEERINSGLDGFWWFIVVHNWNSVCLSGILSCALRLKEDPYERAWYVAVIEKLLKHSEDGFEASGFYLEGVGYWGYGFSHYITTAEMVCGVTGGRIDWLKKPRTESVSHFGYRMEIQDGAYPSFADCVSNVKPPQWLMHWLNNRIDPARTQRKTITPTAPFDVLHYQWADVMNLLLFHQIDLNQAYAADDQLDIREWFEDVQFLISRPGPESKSRLAATFKGGHNGGNHNHNDLGTFTVLIDGEELLTDPGAEKYTKRTFSVNRYVSNLLNSFGHPVPVVAGQLQFPDDTYHRTGFGRDAYTVLIDTTFSKDIDRVIVEMDRAYKVPHLTNLIRGFTYDRTGEGSVEVWDQVIFEKPDTYETAVITYADWEMQPNSKLRVSANGKAVEVEVSSEQGEFEFAHCVIQESSTPTRLSWRLKQPVLEAAIRIRVTPAS